MRKWVKAGVSAVASAALVSSMLALPVSAYASGGNGGSVGSDTNWEVPDSKMTNTVTVDGTLYKVITTWANAWALSGPDYLGISNSGTLNQSGGASATESLAEAQNNSMLGIWASTANEVPNAYNWNYFYNLALAAEGEDGVDTAAIDVANNNSPGFDTESGVWVPFKYRPEIIWTSNSLGMADTATYTELIREGKYYTDTNADPDTDAEVSDTSAYYIDGDEKYDPYVVDAGQDNTVLGSRGNSYDFLECFYDLADKAEKVIADTADYTSDVTVDTVTWKNMNELPRTTRYEASEENPTSARDSALDLEKILRGGVYYTLSQIAAGNVSMKKVAFLTGDPDTTSGTAKVVVYDFGDAINGGNSDNGKASISGLVVDQLAGTDGTTGGSGATAYTTYTVTADDLLTCDYIVDTNGSMTTSQLRNWVFSNASTEELQNKALDDVQYMTQLPAVMNSHNFTAEKLIWAAFDICFFYPELWPNMELVTFWYDNIYHLKSDAVKTAMQYGLANSTLPAETDLNSLTEGYSAEDIDAKAVIGYDWYQSVKLVSPYNTELYAQLAPSDTYTQWVEEYKAEEGTPDVDEPEEPEATVPTFSDVAYGTTAWYLNALDFVVSNGIMTGYDNSDKFGIGDTMTRAQMAVVLWRVACPDEAAAYNSDATNTTNLSDVASNTWYTAAANWAVSEGVINGSLNKQTNTRTFQPNATLTFEQFCAILGNYLATDEEVAAADASVLASTFADGTAISPWAVQSVAWAYEYGVFTGSIENGNVYIHALNGVERERAAGVFYNLNNAGLMSFN